MADKKVLFTLNIDNYAPEITRLTFPLMRYYANRIGAHFHVITKRKYPRFPIPYEKLQMYDLAREMKATWNLYFDADTLIHPEFFDATNHIPRDTVANNGCDLAPIRWGYDKYFIRDGRNIGTCGWCMFVSDLCLDFWQPLDEKNDMTMEEALQRCWPTMIEASPYRFKTNLTNEVIKDENDKPITIPKPVIDREHLLDDFVMSRNVARYGLKYTTLIELCQKLGFKEFSFFYHKYTMTIEEKAAEMRETLNNWKIPEHTVPDLPRDFLTEPNVDTEQLCR